MKAPRAPWFAPSEPVHHLTEQCQRGRRIVPGVRRLGTGERPVCDECARLLTDDACVAAPPPARRD